jgi:hypothetical protein
MRQLAEAQTNLCVLNGAAYGGGFGILDATGLARHVLAGEDLAEALLLRVG